MRDLEYLAISIPIVHTFSKSIGENRFRAKKKRNSSRGLLLLREQGRSRLMAAIADDGFGEIRQCVATLHSAGLGDGEEAGRGHLSLGTAIAKVELFLDGFDSRGPHEGFGILIPSLEKCVYGRFQVGYAEEDAAADSLVIQ